MLDPGMVTVGLEDPSWTAEAVAAGNQFREEATTVAALDRQQQRIEMLFEVSSQLGHRLSMAELQIQHLQEALRDQ